MSTVRNACFFLFFFSSFCYATPCNTTTVYNPFTQKLDYVCNASTSSTSPSSYILNQSAYQVGAVFNVSSGTVQNQFNTNGTDNFNNADSVNFIGFSSATFTVPIEVDNSVLISSTLPSGYYTSGGLFINNQNTGFGQWYGPIIFETGGSPAFSMGYESQLNGVGGGFYWADVYNGMEMRLDAPLSANQLVETGPNKDLISVSTNSWIQNRNTLQTGATFYVSSGTVAGQFSAKSIKWSDGTIQVSSPTAGGGGGNFINNQNTLQTGATFYVSSGTVAGNFYEKGQTSLDNGAITTDGAGNMTLLNTAPGGIINITYDPGYQGLVLGYNSSDYAYVDTGSGAGLAINEGGQPVVINGAGNGAPAGFQLYLAGTGGLGMPNSAGVATLSGGVTTVLCNNVFATSSILLSYMNISGTPGILYSGGISYGTYFSIFSTSGALDNSDVAWAVFN